MTIHFHMSAEIPAEEFLAETPQHGNVARITATYTTDAYGEVTATRTFPAPLLWQWAIAGGPLPPGIVAVRDQMIAEMVERTGGWGAD